MTVRKMLVNVGEIYNSPFGNNFSAFIIHIMVEGFTDSGTNLRLMIAWTDTSQFLVPYRSKTLINKIYCYAQWVRM